MRLEMEFQGSKVSDIIENSGELEIFLDGVQLIQDNSSDSIPRFIVKVCIRMVKAKYLKLPKQGILTDGELYGIPGKALNGRIPLDYQSNRDVELCLSYEDQEFTIRGKGIHIAVEPASLPAELKH